MANVALHLLENQVLTGDVRVPLEFKLPANALPSFQGEYTNVSWELSAKLDISWHSHMEEKAFLRIWTTTSETPAPVAAENTEQRPKANITIPSNIYQPGESIKGQFVIEDLGRLRSVRASLVLTEDCSAEGVIMSDQKTAT